MSRHAQGVVPTGIVRRLDGRVAVPIDQLRVALESGAQYEGESIGYMAPFIEFADHANRLFKCMDQNILLPVLASAALGEWLSLRREYPRKSDLSDDTVATITHEKARLVVDTECLIANMIMYKKCTRAHVEKLHEVSKERGSSGLMLCRKHLDTAIPDSTVFAVFIYDKGSVMSYNYIHLHNTGVFPFDGQVSEQDVISQSVVPFATVVDVIQLHLDNNGVSMADLVAPALGHR